MNEFIEPQPAWPGAPRYWPDRPFPPYTYLPGKNPHPVFHPNGHSFETPFHAGDWNPDQWNESEAYLFGVDLYHFGYFWEAHECWEALWRTGPRDSVEGMFFRALIQNSAAQLKARTGHVRGVRTLSMRVGGFLEHVRSAIDSPEYLGLSIEDVIEQVRRHYKPMWSTHTPATAQLEGPAPRLCLTLPET